MPDLAAGVPPTFDGVCGVEGVAQILFEFIDECGVPAASRRCLELSLQNTPIVVNRVADLYKRSPAEAAQGVLDLLKCPLMRHAAGKAFDDREQSIWFHVISALGFGAEELNTVVPALLNAGVSPNLLADRGTKETALHLLIESGRYRSLKGIVPIIQLLIDKGADLNARNWMGRTILHEIVSSVNEQDVDEKA